MIHSFKTIVHDIPLPNKFTFPFQYTPHPLCILAAEEVKEYIATQKEWKEELASGKMFGVMVIQKAENGEVGYIAAFSGNIAGKNIHAHFVPPIYDLLQPEGFFKIEEEQISIINTIIDKKESASLYTDLKEKLKETTSRANATLNQAKRELKAAKEKREIRRQWPVALTEEENIALIKESQYQKAEFKRLERSWKEQVEKVELKVNEIEEEIEKLKVERKERSAALQKKLFEQFHLLNANGDIKDLCTIFEQTVHKTPPSGAGECALPKLLQYAYLHQLKPLAMAEFWWGDSPKTEIRHHGYYYPSCKSKCEPILQHMLQGLEIDENPLLAHSHRDTKLETIYEDKWLLVVNKPSGMLSVPGKSKTTNSVYQYLRQKYPDATGPMIVHRLDMSTSGLLLVAKTKEVHQHLQAQFENRSIKKRYIALLNGIVKLPKEKGSITLPICPDIADRPRQMVSEEYGKSAITEYQILNISEGRTRISFYPLTGRTHQLRVHSAHTLGLGCPILGDELYGRKADRLYLHAEYIEFQHPIYLNNICVQQDADF